nr:ankyrin repeat and EF-hand domain-containing protein 1a isoform X1 [Nothobranchius furzeri]XP_015803849.2 ankyrin repeat and EF-hand domain-containing protein 1a isoform X1 [Nothobranchius furzeri]
MTSSVAKDPLEVQQICRLLQFVCEGNSVWIEKMLNLGVENLINLTEPKENRGVLHQAVSTGKEELIDLLLSKGATPNVQNTQGQTPVMLAAERGNHIMMTKLIQKQADMRLLDAEGRGVLFYCNYPTRYHIRCLQLALQNQADINNVSRNGDHVFLVMCKKAHEVTPQCLMMLDAGVDPNTVNQKTRRTALMEAAQVGSLQLVRAILRKGGDPSAVDKKHLTAAHYAAMGGFLQVIQVLSAYFADFNVISYDGCTPLHYAAAEGNASCCKFLAQRGCDPKLKNQAGLLPLQIAKDSNHQAAAKQLSEAGKQHSKGHKSGGSLLSARWFLTLHDWSNEFEADLRKAFESRDTVTIGTFVSVLKELNAPVEPDHLQTVIAAHDQRSEGHINVTDFIKGVKYIKKEFVLSSYMPKTPVEKQGKKGGKKKGGYVPPFPICTLPRELQRRRPDGGPPLFMIEDASNHSDTSRFYSDHPPEHPLMNDSGWYMETPEKTYVNINFCVRRGDFASLDLAFSKEVPVDVQDEYYKTPLMVACSIGNIEMVQYLLRRGAHVNSHDEFLWTPLHHAAFEGHRDIVELLVLEYGASVDVRDLSRSTPLMYAIQRGHPSCVDFLIKEGASVTAASKSGENCLQKAIAFGNSEVIDLVKNSLASLPKSRTTEKTKKGTPKPDKQKSFAAAGALHTNTPAVTSGNTPTQMDSKSVVVINNMIAAGKVNRVDISFVPKTVWGKPPSTSQLMSKMERRRERISLDFDRDDLLVPFSRSTQRKVLGLTKVSSAGNSGMTS